MGDLAYVQFINIAAGTSSDVAAAVKVTDGHQRVSGNNARAEQGKAASKGKKFLRILFDDLKVTLKSKHATEMAWRKTARAG